MPLKYVKNVLSVLLSAFLLFLAGCGSLAVKSLWKDSPISIDARSDDWSSGTYIKEADCSFYARNDRENLYLCLISSNRDLGERIMKHGLSLWIESDKEKDNRFGIRLPAGKNLGFQDASGRKRQGISGTVPDESRGRREQDMLPEHDINSPVLSEEYELISKDGLLEGRYGFSEDSGIRIKTGVFQGRFIYELKLPLKAKNAAMGEIAADASSVIKLNFTLDNILMKREKGTERDRDYDVRGRVGMPEGEGMQDGQGGRAGNEQGMQTGKKFELKIDLSLAYEGAK